MQKTLIHIGYHKTGTSWFQKSFYPKVTNYELVSRSFTKELIIKPHFIEFDQVLSRNSYDLAYKNKDIILCDEGLMGNPHFGGFNGSRTLEIGQRLKSIFKDPSILILIRNQKSILTSLYLQYLKIGGVYSFNKYLNIENDNLNYRFPRVCLNQFRYFEIIRFYESLFGTDRIEVYLYEDFLYQRDAFLKQLCDLHEFDININSVSNTKINESIPYGTMNLNRLTNLFTDDKYIYKNYLIDLPLFRKGLKLLTQKSLGQILSRSIKPEDLLNSKTDEYLYKYFQESNRKLADEYNLDLIKYNYPL